MTNPSEEVSGLIKETLNLITDWYIPAHNPLSGFIYPKAATIAEYPILHAIAYQLLEQCKERTADGYDEFVVRVHDRSYRGHLITTIEGQFFALRRMPTSVPSIETLGLHKGLREVLLSPGLNKGGLVMICGETGQGKSTTCASVVMDRMLKLGAFTLTIEDPPEMPLHGQHGDGRCLQTEVKSGSFAEAMRGAMRCYPTVNGSILYLGETRDAESAAEVLRIAMNGNLVFTTLHADSVPNGIRRLLSLAQVRMGEEEAYNIMSSVFRVGMHQTLEPTRPTPTNPATKKLVVEFLISDSGKTPVANKIRKKDLLSLGTDIQQQRTILEKNGSEALLALWKI